MNVNNLPRGRHRVVTEGCGCDQLAQGLSRDEQGRQLGRIVAAVATVQWNLEQVLERPDGLRVDVHVVACTPARPTTYTHIIIVIIIIIRSFINDSTHTRSRTRCSRETGPTWLN